MLVQKFLQVDNSNCVNVMLSANFNYNKGQELLKYVKESDGSIYKWYLFESRLNYCKIKYLTFDPVYGVRRWQKFGTVEYIYKYWASLAYSGKLLDIIALLKCDLHYTKRQNSICTIIAILTKSKAVTQVLMCGFW